MTSRVHHARLLLSRVIARSTVELVLQTGDELRFRPGQFISIEVGRDEDQNPILRSYSIASPPHRRGEIALIVRIIEGGLGSTFFTGLGPGDPVRFTGPMGFFVNELIHPGDVVYVATGTGIAPILPMIQETLERHEGAKERGRVLLHWGSRHEDELFWQREIDELQGRYREFTARIYVSRPSAGWPGQRGRVTGPVLDELPGLEAPTFYLCGSGQMVTELKAALQTRGVDRRRQIRTEIFFD